MRFAAALALATLLAPVLADAAWLPGGNRIGDGDAFVAAASGGHVVVAWTRQVVSGRSEVRAQAWTADGDLAAGWSSAGVLVSDLPGVSAAPSMCDDGAGGVFVAWISYQVNEWSTYLQHLSAAGSVAPGWAAEGLPLGVGAVSVYTSAPAIAPDGAGGVLAGWSEYEYDGAPRTRVRIHRIDAGGAPTAGWPAGGHVISNAYEVGLAVDDQQHVFASMAEYDEDGGMRVQRLRGDATLDPAWPDGGAQVPNARAPIRMGLVPDGAGGVFAGWWEGVICLDHGFCPPALRSTTRIRGDGTPDQGWTPAPQGHSSAPDETGGMLLGVDAGGRPAALRLDTSGAPMPGWASGGNPGMTEVVSLNTVLVAGDGGGGAFLAWTDWRTGTYRLYASRLDATGRLADGWPATGSFVDADRGSTYLYQTWLVSLGGGIAIAVWSESTPQGIAGYLTALRPGEPGPLATLGPVQAEVGFGVVQVRPNPAHGTIVAIIELPDESPARVDLVDAAGRVLESQDFDFMWRARGAVRFNQARALPPGVYWVQVTQGARRSTKKVAVIE